MTDPTTARHFDDDGQPIEIPAWLARLLCGRLVAFEDDWAVVERDFGSRGDDGPPIRFMCGYVLLPDGHPWLYSDDDSEAHGGITYRDDNVIGFDTHHAGDVWPGTWSERLSGDLPFKTVWSEGTMIDETKRLADAARKASSV